MVTANYKVDESQDQIIVCSQDGHVRGYSAYDDKLWTTLMVDEKKGDAVVEDLLQEKQELLMKLKGLQGNVRQIKSGDSGHAVISPDTSIGVELRINDEESCLDLILKTETKTTESKTKDSSVATTDNNSVVRCAAVYSMDGGVFDGESYVVHPKNASNTLVIPLRPQKDIATDLEIHALVEHVETMNNFMYLNCLINYLNLQCLHHPKDLCNDQVLVVVFTLQKQVRVIANWLAKQITLTAEDAYLKEANANIVLESQFLT